MSGGGGFDPGKELANLDKSLSLSQNAPLIAAATAIYLTGGAAAPAVAGTGMGAGAAGAATAAGAGGLGSTIGAGLGLGAAEAAGASTLAGGLGAGTAGGLGIAGAGGFGSTVGAGLGLGAAEAAGASTLAGAGTAGGLGLGTMGVTNAAGGLGAGIGAGIGPGLGAAGVAAPSLAAPSGIANMATAAKDWAVANPKTAIGLGLGAAELMADRKSPYPGQEPYDGPLNKLKYDPDRYKPLEVKPPTPYTPVYKDYRNMADGGFLGAVGKGFGADLERLLNRQQQDKYATPPLSYDAERYDPEVGTKMVARPGMAGGGLADLGGYADYARGGRMLKGPGDGMSDSIPAVIAGKQPARLANDEFVVPADVVSHLGNGSSDAGAKQLYRMMDKVRAARTGKQAQAKQINPTKYMPA